MSIKLSNLQMNTIFEEAEAASVECPDDEMVSVVAETKVEWLSGKRVTCYHYKKAKSFGINADRLQKAVGIYQHNEKTLIQSASGDVIVTPKEAQKILDICFKLSQSVVTD